MSTVPEAPAAAPAAPPPAQRIYSGLRIEIDVTPRWYAPGAGFDDDLQAILAVMREAGGDLRKLLVDFQAGTSGVRFILGVPSGVSTDAIEEARVNLAGALDALDLVSPRRRAVTAARLERSRRQQEAAEPPLASAEPPAPADAVVPPPEGGGGPSGSLPEEQPGEGPEQGPSA